MSYVKKTIVAGDYMSVKYYHTGRYHQKGETRVKRQQPTPESVKAANKRSAMENLCFKLHANFKPSDYWVTLTYKKDNKRISLEEMQNDIKRFFENLRREYKKQGKSLKYICVLRVGEKGSRHFHIIINNEGLELKKISKHWKKGFTDIHEVFEQNDKCTFEDIAKYMIKESEITREALQKPTLKRFTCSRNLAEPIVKKQIIKRSSTFKNKPQVPKGWYEIADSKRLYVNLYGFICYECRYKKLKVRQKEFVAA